jgi:hypothetical protein
VSKPVFTVKGYVIGKEKEHFAGEMEFEFPNNWEKMNEYEVGLMIQNAERKTRKFLFKTVVEYPDGIDPRTDIAD